MSDWSCTENCNPQDDDTPYCLVLYPLHPLCHRASVLLESMHRWDQFHKDTSERDTCMVCLCLWLLHTSLSPLLLEHLPSECPWHPGPGGLRAEVGERSPGGRQACKCAEAPPPPDRPRGAKGNSCWIHCCPDFFPPEYPLTQGTARKPSDYVFDQPHQLFLYSEA